MSEKYGNNKVWISGVIENEFEYSHEVRGEKFYRNRVKVERLSGTKDLVPILVSDFLMTNIKGLKGKSVELCGQFRSYNKLGEDGNKHLLLFVFVTEIYEREEEKANNSIYLEGYICKPPVFRTTPLGREITDLLIAVNRNYGKSDYIPCIAWGRVARFMRHLQVGSNLKIWGTIQSRQYLKEGTYRTAYEISIQRIQLLNSDK